MPVVKDKITVLPGLGGRNPEMIYCAGNEKVFMFLQDVIDELLQLFPSPYINMGGDEATKTYWKVCPLCQKRMQEEHLKEVEDLQGYFMGRLNDYIRSKGRMLMGWDELTNSQLPEGAVILGWQGLGNAALKAADKGLDFVMTPARILYLIRYQGPQWFEPLTYSEIIRCGEYMIMNLCRQTGNRNMKNICWGYRLPCGRNFVLQQPM